MPGSRDNSDGRNAYTLTIPSHERIDMSGSGDVESDGNGDNLTVVVDLAGPGDVAIAASDRLDVSISGFGAVTSQGNPGDLRRRVHQLSMRGTKTRNPALAARANESGLVGERHDLHSRMQARLGQDVGNVRLHRALTDEQSMPDLAIG